MTLGSHSKCSFIDDSPWCFTQSPTAIHDLETKSVHASKSTASIALVLQTRFELLSWWLGEKRSQRHPICAWRIQNWWLVIKLSWQKASRLCRYSWRSSRCSEGCFGWSFWSITTCITIEAWSLSGSVRLFPAGRSPVRWASQHWCDADMQPSSSSPCWLIRDRLEQWSPQRLQELRGSGRGS